MFGIDMFLIGSYDLDHFLISRSIDVDPDAIVPTVLRLHYRVTSTGVTYKTTSIDVIVE